jgi:hypothetical protein
MFMSDGASFVFGMIPDACSCFFVGRASRVCFSESCFSRLSSCAPIPISEGARACCGSSPALMSCDFFGRLSSPPFTASVTIFFSSFALIRFIRFFAAFLSFFVRPPLRRAALLVVFFLLLRGVGIAR